MLKQLDFIPIILKGVGQPLYLYATDILYQLYKHKADLSIKELMDFFKQRRPLEVWETIMTLKDLDYIRPVHSGSDTRYRITDKGTEKIQMILAVFRLGVPGSCIFKA